MDAKFNELKQKIGEKDSKVVQGVKAVRDWAKENPGKATVAVAILTRRCTSRWTLRRCCSRFSWQEQQKTFYKVKNFPKYRTGKR